MAPADMATSRGTGFVRRRSCRRRRACTASCGTSAIPNPECSTFQYPISATPNNTPRDPEGPWVVPGTYTVRLTVNGKTYTQPLTVRMDPRVKTSTATLARQFALSKGVYDDINRARGALDEVRALRSSLRDIRGRASGELRGSGRFGRSSGRCGRGRRAVGSAVAGWRRWRWWWRADTGWGDRPARPALRRLRERRCSADDAARGGGRGSSSGMWRAAVARWDAFRTRVVPGLNARLRAAGPAGDRDSSLGEMSSVVEASDAQRGRRSNDSPGGRRRWHGSQWRRRWSGTS